VEGGLIVAEETPGNEAQDEATEKKRSTRKKASAPPPPPPPPLAPPRAPRAARPGWFGDYCGFRILVTPSLVRTLYIVGHLTLLAWGIYLLAVRAWELPFGRYIKAFEPWVGLGVLIAGNLLWRLYCEMFVILFGMAERLKVIEKDLRK
jgi:hypothetical protein